MGAFWGGSGGPVGRLLGVGEVLGASMARSLEIELSSVLIIVLLVGCGILFNPVC